MGTRAGTMEAGVEGYRAVQANERVTIRATRHGLMCHFTKDTEVGLALACYGERAWAELEITRQYARGLVLDIGANIGTHALVYAQTASAVIAYEPQWHIYRLLVANLALNCADNVEAKRIALGDSCGFTHVPRLCPDSPQCYGGVAIGEGEEPVELFQLDYFCLEPSFLKIDVEGSELAVLQGATETIRRCRPVMYIENDKVDKAAALIAYVEELGYSWEWHTPPAFPKVNYYQQPVDIYPPGCLSVNMLCLPKD